MDVVFIRGHEINEAVGEGRFDVRYVYAQLWFGPGQVAIVQLVREKRHHFGDPYARRDFDFEFMRQSRRTGKDQEGKEWRVETRWYEKFVFELSVAEVERMRAELAAEPVSDEEGNLESEDMEDEEELLFEPTEATVIYVNEDDGWIILQDHNGYILGEMIEGDIPSVTDVVYGLFESPGDTVAFLPEDEGSLAIRIEELGLSEEEVVDLYVENARE